MFQVSLLQLDDPDAQYSTGISLHMVVERPSIGLGDIVSDREILQNQLKHLLKDDVTVHIEEVEPEMSAIVSIGRAIKVKVGK